MSDITNALTEIGLSEKESRVYFHLLSMGNSSPKDVANTLNIPRSTAYEVLQSLEKKGFAFVSGDKDAKEYVPSKPDVLLHQVDIYLEKFETAEQTLSEVTEEIEKLHPKFASEPGVDFFDQGSEESVYADILNTDVAIVHCVLSSKVANSRIESNASSFFAALSSKKVVLDGLLEPGSNTIATLNKVMGTRYEVEHSPFNIDTDVYIYDEKIALVSYGEEFGAIIRAPDIASGMRELLALATKQVMYENGIPETNRIP